MATDDRMSETPPQAAVSSLKRTRDQVEDGLQQDKNGHVAEEETSDDDDFGPALPSDIPKKKRKRLPYEKLYISALPASARYSKSLMHRDQLCFVTITPITDFLITSSIDGVVKFWKKTTGDVESVKEFKAHTGEIKSVAVSRDGTCFATAGVDKSVKIFDIINFDLLSILQLERTPRTVCWVHRKGASLPLLAVSFEESNAIEIFDGRGESQTPIHIIEKLHRSSVIAIAYNSIYDCAVSADDSGMIEYWRPYGSYEKPDNVFHLKSSTNLFEFKKAKSYPTSITLSPSGQRFATFSFPDRKVRVFDFASGKLYRTYDESLATITEMQQAGTALHKLEDVEFGRRLATERDVENTTLQPRINVIFDESSNFILYGSLHGTKVINILTNRVVKVYGDTEPFRSLNLTLYQGAPQRKTFTTVEMAASSNPLLEEAESRDPMFVTSAVGKPRFYIFTNETTISKSTRDIQNEKPRNISSAPAQAKAKSEALGTQATIHTSMGDINLRLFPQSAPKAVENFGTHSRRGYYNNTIFHRVIRKFMIQGGDPLGDGTGGESIWEKEFEDEFSASLKHDQPFTLSMANAGPNTNGSQFFITTERCPWLDGKHTVFGRAVGGLDVVKRIENVRVWKEKPEEEIKVVSIDVS